MSERKENKEIRLSDILKYGSSDQPRKVRKDEKEEFEIYCNDRTANVLMSAAPLQR